MTVLSVLKKSLIGTIVTVFQSNANPEYYHTEQLENFKPRQITVTDVIYQEPYGEYEQEGGDNFIIIFEGGEMLIPFS